MPFGVAKLLKEQRAPFLFCTAYGHPVTNFEDAARIEKPYSEEELAEVLTKLLGL